MSNEVKGPLLSVLSPGASAGHWHATPSLLCRTCQVPCFRHVHREHATQRRRAPLRCAVRVERRLNVCLPMNIILEATAPKLRLNQKSKLRNVQRTQRTFARSYGAKAGQCHEHAKQRPRAPFGCAVLTDIDSSTVGVQ